MTAARKSCRSARVSSRRVGHGAADHAPTLQLLDQRLALAGIGRGHDRLQKNQPGETAFDRRLRRHAKRQFKPERRARRRACCAPRSARPSARSIFREMARPSPVPPNFRDDEVSACTNGWNNFLMSSGARPMPVSVTSKRNTIFAGDLKLRLDADDDFAVLGEFDAVADQIEQHLPQPGGVAGEPLGNFAVDHGGEREFFAGARAWRRFPAPNPPPRGRKNPRGRWSFCRPQSSRNRARR